MRKDYTLSNKAASKHMLHFLLMLVVAAAMAAASILLGFQRWSSDQYIWVNILCLAVAVAAANGLAHFGGHLDGKKDSSKQSLKFLIISAAAGVIIWGILAIMGSPAMMTVLIFVADVALSVWLVNRVWTTLVNFGKMLSNESDKEGNRITYPGEYILHEVHTSDALTSSFGKVLIRKNAVLFVLPEMNRGFVLVHPSGAMELKKTSYFKNEIKENDLSVSSIRLQAEDGLQRVMKLVEEVCAEKQIPVPEFTYDYALFLPNFDPRNAIWDQSSFEDMTGNHSWRSDNKKYSKYQSKAETLDYFQGKACYSPDELMQMLNIMNRHSSADVDQNDLETIVEGIAQACGLKENESR